MKIFRKIFQDPFFLAILSALLLRLSFPKFDCWILAWVAFVPLFFSAEKQKPVKVLLVSWIWGFVFFASTLFWLINVTIPGMLVLSACLGFYGVFFMMGYASLKERLSFFERIFFVPALWVLLEFCRAHLLTGFPWALLGYSQTYNLAAIQAADICGAFGVSFMVMFVNILIFEGIVSARAGKKFEGLRFLCPLLIVCLWFSYGSWRLVEDPGKSCGLKISVIQGNISQDIKWVTSFQERIFKKYSLLTEIVRLKQEPDLIVWPETAFPYYMEFNNEDLYLKDLARRLKIPILTGSMRFSDMRYFNSAVLFLSSGRLAKIYDKIHLVPYGEYIPLRKWMPFMANILPIEDFTPGKKYEIFAINGKECPEIHFGVLICFEDIFSGLAAQFVKKGADFLVDITNDGWFGDTASPYQHMQASVLRAVENRVYVVRSANTGISCFIDDTGRILGEVQVKGKSTYVTGSATTMVYKTDRHSLFTKIGDLFAVLSVFYALGIIFLRRRRP
jgi:apolipoprotein N-acyltransferase